MNGLFILLGVKYSLLALHILKDLKNKTLRRILAYCYCYLVQKSITSYELPSWSPFSLKCLQCKLSGSVVAPEMLERKRPYVFRFTSKVVFMYNLKMHTLLVTVFIWKKWGRSVGTADLDLQINLSWTISDLTLKESGMLARSISIDRYRITDRRCETAICHELVKVPQRRDGVRALTNFPLPLHRTRLKESLADETLKSIKWDFQCPGSADN